MSWGITVPQFLLSSEIARNGANGTILFVLVHLLNNLNKLNRMDESKSELKSVQISNTKSVKLKIALKVKRNLIPNRVNNRKDTVNTRCTHQSVERST